MSDLAEFLLARIGDDAAAVNTRTRHLAPAGWSYLEQFGDFGDDERWMIEIPAPRVLAECEAKRRIVEWCSERNLIWAGTLADDPTDPAQYLPGDYVHREDAPVLRLLALPYADHPDYREEWRP